MAGVIILDASVVIAFLEPADVHHDDAVGIFARGPEPLVMHELTLAEVLVAPARAGRDEALLSDLYRIGVRPAVFEAPLAPLLARLRVRTGLKMPDACVLATALQFAHEGEARLATFDARLAAAARSLGVRVV
jgi:predicted nucleic acid-binding protein